MTTSHAPFRLASRFAEVGFSDIVNIRNRVMELSSAGTTVYQFEGGEPFVNTPEFIKQAMIRALAENKTRYAPSSGVPELRAAIAEKLRVKNRIAYRWRRDLLLAGLNESGRGLLCVSRGVQHKCQQSRGSRDIA